MLRWKRFCSETLKVEQVYQDYLMLLEYVHIAIAIVVLTRCVSQQPANWWVLGVQFACTQTLQRRGVSFSRKRQLSWRCRNWRLLDLLESNYCQVTKPNILQTARQCRDLGVLYAKPLSLDNQMVSLWPPRGIQAGLIGGFQLSPKGYICNAYERACFVFSLKKDLYVLYH